MRSPPVSLVSVVRCPELHASISTHLYSLDLAINTLALPYLSKVSLLLPPPKPSPSDSPPTGILKRDWPPKHHTKVPAVVAALISLDRVSSSALNLTISKGSSAAATPTDEESQIKQSLFRLGSVFAELAGTYYRDEGRRIKARTERKNSGHTDLNIQYSFKVAVFSEFRRDWVEALLFYENAYHMLREVSVGASTKLSVIQRLVEIKNVVEQLHFKIATLLLHGGKIVEAVTWFRQHNASYKKLKGAPEAIFLHWEWMSRQFLVFAELLEISSTDIQSSSHITAGNEDKPLTKWQTLN